MERQLPLVDIAGTAFYIDVQKEELRQKEDAGSRIPFSVFDLDGNGYTFLYDKELRRAAENRNLIAEAGNRYEWVTLPALMELDPLGIALKYGIPIEVLCDGVQQSSDQALQSDFLDDSDMGEEE